MVALNVAPPIGSATTQPLFWIAVILLIIALISTTLIVLMIAQRKVVPQRVMKLLSLKELEDRNQSIFDSLPPAAGGRSSLMNILETVKNPTYSWANTQVDTPKGKMSVMFPVFRELKPNNVSQEAVRKIAREFLTQFSDDLRDSQIYVVEAIAESFLALIHKELEGLGAEVYMHSKVNANLPEPKPGRKIVLFDIALNTGLGVTNTLSRISSSKSPSLLLFVVVNDLVPKTTRQETWLHLERKAEIKYLYRLSDILLYWEHDQKLAAALLTVRAAINGALNWQSEYSYIEAAFKYVQREALGLNKKVDIHGEDSAT